MKICPKCGAQNNDINSFCSFCGYKFENASVPNHTQTINNSSECQITFIRPEKFQMMGNVFHIKIDNLISYELKNGGEIKIPMSAGQHFIEISVFGVPRKKQFSIQAIDNMTLICKPNASAVSLFSTPIKVTDSNGREY